MQEFQKTLKFKAKDEQAANAIMHALVKLMVNNSIEDLTALGNFSHEKPGWVKKAIQYKSFL